MSICVGTHVHDVHSAVIGQFLNINSLFQNCDTQVGMNSGHQVGAHAKLSQQAIALPRYFKLLFKGLL